MIRTTLSSIKNVIKGACISYFGLECIGHPMICSGSSMEPVLNHNDIIFAERLSVKTHNYEKGDIVILKCPDDPKQLICKRILALPGDKIWHDFVDYIIVPKGHVWLEGDNKDNSTDSRNFGPVPQGLIRSRVLCKLWPPTDFYMIGNIYN